MQNALNANTTHCQSYTDGRKLTPVISTFPFEHGHPERLQFDGLRILLGRGKKRPNLRTSAEISYKQIRFFRR